MSTELAGWPPGVDVHPVRWAEVDIVALRENVAAVVSLIDPDPAVMAMVKANAYGHDAVVAARAFLDGGAHRLGVSSPEEALRLRERGIEAPLLNVNWTHPSAVEAMLHGEVELTVYDLDAVHRIAAVARRLGVVSAVHLKLDTGMNRLGVRRESLDDVVRALVSASPWVRVVGIFTHLADADGADLGFTMTQLERFEEMLPGLRDRFPGATIHAANSAALLRVPAARFDLVRPGIVLYGYPPDHCSGSVAVRPAMTVVACVTQVKSVDRGETVGYGRTWTAPRRSRIAVVAAGYADGVFRAQANRGQVRVGGVRCPIIGRVSMDQIGVDVSAVDTVVPGDEAVLFGVRDGARLGADEVAASAGTIAYEVLCAVSARVPRVAVGFPLSGGDG